MQQRIGISDPLPMFRSGLRTALANASYAVDEPTDIVDWAGGGASRSVLLSLSSDDGWTTLDSIRASNPDTVVVTLLDEPSTARYYEALSRGARTALPRSSSSSDVVEVMTAALSDRVILPAPVIESMTRVDRGDALATLSDEERLWLKSVGEGVTVEELAWRQGYSRRTMYRRLDTTYRRLGTNRRGAALLEAARRGLI